MPYIKEYDRYKFEPSLEFLANNIECAGDLNYVISTICGKILLREGLNYAKLNELMGALECTKLELYRRMCFYEDNKIEENGDVKEYKELNS